MTATPASNFPPPAGMVLPVALETAASGSMHQTLPLASAGGALGGGKGNLAAHDAFWETPLMVEPSCNVIAPGSEFCFARLFESIATAPASSGEPLTPGNSIPGSLVVQPDPAVEEPAQFSPVGASAASDAGWLALLFANVGGAAPPPPAPPPPRIELLPPPVPLESSRPDALPLEDEAVVEMPVVEPGLPAHVAGPAVAAPGGAWVTPERPALAGASPAPFAPPREPMTPTAGADAPIPPNLPATVRRAAAAQSYAAASGSALIADKPAIELRLQPASGASPEAPGETDRPGTGSAERVSPPARGPGGGLRGVAGKQMPEPSLSGGRNSSQWRNDPAAAARETPGSDSNSTGPSKKDTSPIGSPPKGRDRPSLAAEGAADPRPGTLDTSKSAGNPVSHPSETLQPRVEVMAPAPVASVPVVDSTRESTHTDSVRGAAEPEIAEPAGAPAALRATQPRQISIDLKDMTGEDVRLTVKDARSDVEVSVHAGDEAVRDSLRAGLRDLAGNLERAGYHVETPVIEAALSGAFEGGGGPGEGSRGGEDAAGQRPPRHRSSHDTDERNRSNSGQPDQRNRRNWQQMMEENAWQTL